MQGRLFSLGGIADAKVAVAKGVGEAAEVTLRAAGAEALPFGQVAELIQGLETPCGLDLLSTVHWVLK